MTELREIGAEEFVRRLRNLIEEVEDCKFALFIGAGCSVSSGIPAAGALVKRWLPRLKKYKTGDDDNYEEWVTDIYPDYEEDKASLYYGKVIEDLFFTADERQREIERLTEGKDPGFGYAVLAQLTTHEICGRHCNAILTVNFDDLIADAQYLYTHKKPLIIAHEALVGFVRLTRTRPIVIKLHGDARLEPKNTEQETETLAENVKKALKDLLSETGLIFIGYGGNDKSLAAIFNELPAKALPWGIYWVSDKIPESDIGAWLKERDAVWVKHKDFDELMLLLWNEFGLKHPDDKRFDRLLDTYYETFKKLKKKVEAKPETAEKRVLEKAAEKAVSEFTSWLAVEFAAERYIKKKEKADEIYREGLKKFPDSYQLLGYYAIFLTYIRKEHDKAEEYYKKALEADPTDVVNLGNYATFLTDIRKDHDTAEEYYKKALEADPNHANNLGNYATFLWQIRKDHDTAEEYYKKALEDDPTDATILDNYANFLTDIRKEHDKAEEYYKKALEVDPTDATILGNYANFLTDIRKEHDKAEEYYKKAFDADPTHANILGNYAGFLLAQGKQEEGYSILQKALSLADEQSSLSLECLFYQYAHTKEKKVRAESLAAIKKLLKSGVRSPGWNLKDNVARAAKDGHPDPEFLDKLSRVISDEIELQELEGFDIWRND